MLGEPRSSLLERALEALPAAPARGAHGLALPPLDELVDFDRWLLVAPDVGALSHCACTLRFSQASRSGQSRRRGRKSKDLCSAAVRSKAAVIAHRRVPVVWRGLLRPTTQTRAAGQSVRRGSRSRWEPWPAPLPPLEIVETVLTSRLPPRIRLRPADTASETSPARRGRARPLRRRPRARAARAPSRPARSPRRRPAPGA